MDILATCFTPLVNSKIPVKIADAKEEGIPILDKNGLMH